MQAVASGVVAFAYPSAHARVTSKAPALRSRLVLVKVRLASVGCVQTMAVVGGNGSISYHAWFEKHRNAVDRFRTFLFSIPFSLIVVRMIIANIRDALR